MRRLGLRTMLGIVALVAGCVQPSSPSCGDLVCAVGQICAPDGMRCALPAQIDACDGLADLAPCTYEGAASGVCRGGVCTPFSCGNATVDTGEVCDDGNARSGDGCSADCMSTEVCGNNIRDNAEACDDGNTISGDGCQANCALPTCGDGSLDLGEVCDDGNNVNGDGCNARCTSNETCGNGVVDPQKGEECDTAGESASCDPDCTIPRCRDGYWNQHTSETCDTGGIETSMCDVDCTTPMCGDGLVNNASGETCDLGMANSDLPNALCRTTCTLRRCGDGIVDNVVGEVCDSSVPSALSCTDFGFYDNVKPTCSQSCSYDTSGCTGYCGDRDRRQGIEVCEGKAPPGESCLDFGYEGGPLGCGASCLRDLSGCQGAAPWTTLPSIPLPPGLMTARGIWGTSPTNVVVVGDDGVPTLAGISVYDGASWSTTTFGTTRIWSVWGSGASNMFAVGEGGKILHNTSGTWVPSTVGSSDLISVWGVGANDVYAVGFGGTVLRYTGSWSPVAGGPGVNLWAVWGVPGHIFVGGDNGTIQIFNEAGGWTAPPTGTASRTFRALWGTSENDVFAVANGGYIAHYNGSAWSTMTSGTTANLGSVWGTGSSDVYAVGDNGTTLHWNGSLWSTMQSGTNTNLSAVWGSNGEVFAVGLSGVARHLQSSGSWQAIAEGDGVWREAAWGVGQADVLVAGAFCLLRQWNGSAWSTITVTGCTGTDLYAVWASSLTDVYVGGASGKSFHLSGGTWTTMTPAGSAAIRGIWGSSPSDVFAVGDGGVILHSADGTSWTTMSSPTAFNLEAVWGSGPSDVFAGSENRAVFHYNGSGWSGMPGDQHVYFYGVWGTGPKNVYAVGWSEADQSAAIRHYDGTSWSVVPVPTAPGLDAIAGTSASDIYAVGENGVIVHYDGTAWSPMRSGTTLTLVGVAANREVIAVGHSGEARRYGRFCAATETRCGDGADDDCDGHIDCVDADCAGDASCIAGGLCAGWQTIGCNTNVNDTTVGAQSQRLSAYGCDDWLEVGRERIYRVQPSTSTSVTATLTNLTADLDLIVTDKAPGGGCELTAPGCLGASSTQGNESVTFTATANTPYFIIVDGYGSSVGGYTLTVSCP